MNVGEQNKEHNRCNKRKSSQVVFLLSKACKCLLWEDKRDPRTWAAAQPEGTLAPFTRRTGCCSSSWHCRAAQGTVLCPLHRRKQGRGSPWWEGLLTAGVPGSGVPAGMASRWNHLLHVHLFQGGSSRSFSVIFYLLSVCHNLVVRLLAVFWHHILGREVLAVLGNNVAFIDFNLPIIVIRAR